jgi:predicted nucleic acid-binding protein
VIAVDLNLLVYAHNEAVPQHAAVRRWWEGMMNGVVNIGLPEPVLYAFLRVTTQRGILATPLARPLEDAQAPRAAGGGTPPCTSAQRSPCRRSTFARRRGSTPLCW